MNASVNLAGWSRGTCPGGEEGDIVWRVGWSYVSPPPSPDPIVRKCRSSRPSTIGFQLVLCVEAREDEVGQGEGESVI